MRTSPTTIYLILPPNYLTTHNRFLRLIINMAIRHLSARVTFEQEKKKDELPVLLIMDEFLALGHMREVEKAFALMAGYGLILWPFVQDLGSLQKLYGNNVNAFITNSRAVQVFGASDPITTQFVSDKLGDRKSVGSFLTREPFSVNLRKTSEVELDVAADSNRQYIMRSGKPTLLIEKVPYWNDPFFKEKNFEKYKGAPRIYPTLKGTQ